MIFPPSFKAVRLAAPALLAVMAALAAGRLWLPAPYREGLIAAGRAGLVGGLADWFAVTALFRHPFGLPIPHTAILPRQQARLGMALGRFVGEQVLSAAEIDRALNAVDPARWLARHLADPAQRRRIAETLAGGLIPALAALERPPFARPLTRGLGGWLERTLRNMRPAPWLGGWLMRLLAEDRHRDWLDTALGRLREILAEKEEGLKAVVRQRVREQGGRLVGWAAGAAIASRVAEALARELAQSGEAGEASPLREAAELWLRGEAERLLRDPARDEALRAWLLRAWSRPETRRLVLRLWRGARRGLVAETANGAMVPRFDHLLIKLGQALEKPAVAERCDVLLRKGAAALAPVAQSGAESLIGRVVASWDRRGLTERLEGRLGADLQWIRVNGTVVGFLLGGLLWALGG